MLRQTIYISAIFLFVSCDRGDKNFSQDFVVFESDPRNEEVGFKPTNDQIENANTKLVDYLEIKAKNNDTVYVNSLDRKVPLQDHLEYYKRRYFGRMSTEGEQIIKIEFVFVRCGEKNEWRQMEYTSDRTKDCWWSVLYSIKHDQIYDLKL